MTSVRDLVREMQREMLTGSLEPEKARTICTRMTALTWNCFEEIRDAEEAYNVVLLRHLDSGEPANRSEIRAKTTGEYKRLQEAKFTHKFATDAVVSLRKVLNSIDTEMRLAR